MADFVWTKERTLAATLLAQSSLTVPQVAKEAGVATLTLQKWLFRPEFKTKIDELELERLDDAKRAPYSRRVDRVRDLSESLVAIDKVIDARRNLQFGTDYENKEYEKQGGRTGIMVRKRKTAGGGEYMETWYEYEVDISLLRERRETGKQLAQELGQWDMPSIDPVNASITVEFRERSDGPQRQAE